MKTVYSDLYKDDNLKNSSKFAHRIILFKHIKTDLFFLLATNQAEQI